MMKSILQNDLNTLENDILDFIKMFPGLTSEDIAEHFENTIDVHRAITNLWMTGFANRDAITCALTVRDI